MRCLYATAGQEISEVVLRRKMRETIRKKKAVGNAPRSHTDFFSKYPDCQREPPVSGRDDLGQRLPAL